MTAHKLTNHKCRYCQSNISFFASTKDYHYDNDGTWNTYRCENCKHIFQIPIPTDEELNTFYPDNYYSFSSNKITYSYSFLNSPGVYSRLSFLKRYRNFHHLQVKNTLLPSLFYRLFFKKPLAYNDPAFVKDGKILDYGSGAGDDVNFYGFLGWNAQGIEISKAAVETAKKNNLNIRCGSIEQLEGYKNYYDVVFSCHAFEHVSNIDELFEKIHQSLKSGGKLSFEVPNGYAAAIDTYQDYYFYLGMPVHINLFTPSSVKAILKKIGFKTVETATKCSWESQIASYYLKKQEKNGAPKHNLKRRFGWKYLAAYFITLPAYLKSLRNGKGDNLVVVATK